MKAGDKVPVTIAGQVVAQATVRELGDGTVTLVVPGTLVVMAVRTEIAPDPQQTSAVPESETLITGVDRTSADTSDTTDATVVQETGGTPEVSLPEPTPPSNEPVAASEGATVVEQPTVEPQEPTSPVVSDSDSEQG